jgi:hypothetical protein
MINPPVGQHQNLLESKAWMDIQGIKNLYDLSNRINKDSGWEGWLPLTPINHLAHHISTLLSYFIGCNPMDKSSSNFQGWRKNGNEYFSKKGYQAQMTNIPLPPFSTIWKHI